MNYLAINSYRFNHWSKNQLIEWGVADKYIDNLTLIIDCALLLIISIIVDLIARKLIMRVVAYYVKRSKNDWDDVFYEKRVFLGLAHIIPALIIDFSAEFILIDYPDLENFISKIIILYVIVIIMLVVDRIIKALNHIALSRAYFEGKPVSSFFQLFSIVNYIFGTVLLLSQIIGKSPLAFLGAFGAGAAIFLLVFRDTILGLVASIQVSVNDMVRINDWITMEKYGADGDVIEINLTTVKVRNWDKTITTIPTYALVSDSFKNWRGMTSVGVRRIKRSLLIDVRSIQFADEELLKSLSKVEFIREYIADRQKEIDEYNRLNQIDKSTKVNGRNLTNLGIFRKYATEYIRKHPQVADHETMMVRQLQPTENGLPLEIYCFSSSIEWVTYESIMSDIFDHLLSAIGQFELNLFQSPSGTDLLTMASNLSISPSLSETK
jgi:miniconductance mechanosensitive channel